MFLFGEYYDGYLDFIKQNHWLHGLFIGGILTLLLHYSKREVSWGESLLVGGIIGGSSALYMHEYGHKWPWEIFEKTD